MINFNFGWYTCAEFQPISKLRLQPTQGDQAGQAFKFHPHQWGGMGWFCCKVTKHLVTVRLTTHSCLTLVLKWENNQKRSQGLSQSSYLCSYDEALCVNRWWSISNLFTGSEIWHPDCSFAAAQNGELETDSVSYLSKLNHKHALQKRNLNSFGYCYNGFNLWFLVSKCEIKNKLFKFFFGGRCKCAAYWTSERRFQKLSLTMDYCVVFLDKQVWVWVSIRKT